jgi:hypothetical protein
MPIFIDRGTPLKPAIKRTIDGQDRDAADFSEFIDVSLRPSPYPRTSP